LIVWCLKPTLALFQLYRGIKYMQDVYTCNPRLSDWFQSGWSLLYI